jgi:hypothetical protein
MIEYRVIYASNFQALEKEVSAALNEHWSCVGGLTVSNIGMSQLFIQSVQKGSTTA